MTKSSITRRQIVGGLASTSSFVLSGCFESRHRTLSFGEISVKQKETEYKTTVQVRAGASNIESQEWGTFHDVVLIVMTKGKEEIHRETVGEVGGSMKDTETYSFSVTEVPQYLVYDARESTCDDQTAVDKAIRIKYEGEYLWEITRMTCEEEQEFVAGTPP